MSEEIKKKPIHVRQVNGNRSFLTVFYYTETYVVLRKMSDLKYTRGNLHTIFRY